MKQVKSYNYNEIAFLNIVEHLYKKCTFLRESDIFNECYYTGSV